MGEIRFVGTGETRGYPSLVCKKNCSQRLTVLPTMIKGGYFKPCDVVMFPHVAIRCEKHFFYTIPDQILPNKLS